VNFPVKSAVAISLKSKITQECSVALHGCRLAGSCFHCSVFPTWHGFSVRLVGENVAFAQGVGEFISIFVELASFFRPARSCPKAEGSKGRCGRIAVGTLQPRLFLPRLVSWWR